MKIKGHCTHHHKCKMEICSSKDLQHHILEPSVVQGFLMLSGGQNTLQQQRMPRVCRSNLRWHYKKLWLEHAPKAHAMFVLCVLYVICFLWLEAWISGLFLSISSYGIERTRKICIWWWALVAQARYQTVYTGFHLAQYDLLRGVACTGIQNSTALEHVVHLYTQAHEMGVLEGTYNLG